MLQNNEYNEILGDIDLSKLSKEELMDVESYVSGFFEWDEKSFKNQEKYDYDIDSEYEYDDDEFVSWMINIENVDDISDLDDQNVENNKEKQNILITKE